MAAQPSTTSLAGPYLPTLPTHLRRLHPLTVRNDDMDSVLSRYKHCYGNLYLFSPWESKDETDTRSDLDGRQLPMVITVTV
jgi:hypothetical protein